MIRRSVFLLLIAAMLLAGCVVPGETPTPVPAATARYGSRRNGATVAAPRCTTTAATAGSDCRGDYCARSNRCAHPGQDAGRRPHAHRDDARQLQRQPAGGGRVPGQMRLPGALPQVGRRGAGAQQSDPEQGQSAGRRLLRRRQQLPQPRPGRRHLRAVRLACAGGHPGRSQARRQQSTAAGGFRFRGAELRQELLRRQQHPAAAEPARPDQIAVQRPGRRGKPGHLLARHGLPADHHRGVRGDRQLHLPGFLAGHAEKPGHGLRWLGGCVLQPVQRRAAARATIRWW